MNSCSYSSPNVVNASWTDREVNCARSRDICPRNKTSQFIFVCEKESIVDYSTVIRLLLFFQSWCGIYFFVFERCV